VQLIITKAAPTPVLALVYLPRHLTFQLRSKQIGTAFRGTLRWLPALFWVDYIMNTACFLVLLEYLRSTGKENQSQARSAIHEQFVQWQLSTTEHQVALLLLS
jgi:hypothetical protein